MLTNVPKDVSKMKIIECGDRGFTLINTEGESEWIIYKSNPATMAGLRSDIRDLCGQMYFRGYDRALQDVRKAMGIKEVP